MHCALIGYRSFKRPLLLLLLRNGTLRSIAEIARQERSSGVHREHRPRRTTGSPLVGFVDVRRRMRDPGQLRLTIEDLLEDRTLGDVAQQALEDRDTEQSESSIALQSKLRRLRVIFLDRSFERQEHG